jgi:hypothetical protein
MIKVGVLRIYEENQMVSGLIQEFLDNRIAGNPAVLTKIRNNIKAIK